jgi:7,8-dihydropterin-6-yl-methyl-4-(beta-D-ribofuranosyl)aminobenzene 5'-phosphate synthase
MAALQPVDAVEITLVVDNYVDILAAGAEGVRRFPLAYDFADHEQLVAEHGFSAMITVESGGSRSSVLYDGGMTPKGLAARTGRRRLPLLLHPGAWRDRKVTFPTGAELHLPRPAGPTWRPRAWRWWRSAAPPCCSTTRC